MIKGKLTIKAIGGGRDHEIDVYLIDAYFAAYKHAPSHWTLAHRPSGRYIAHGLRSRKEVVTLASQLCSEMPELDWGFSEPEILDGATRLKIRQMVRAATDAH